MGKHEIIKDTPSSVQRGRGPADAGERTGCDRNPKMALAGVDPAKVEMPKAATISAPRIEIAETKPETIAAGKIELANIEAPHLAPQIDELKPSSGGDAAAADDAAAGACRGERCALCQPIYAAGGFACAGGGARRDGRRAGSLRPCTARCHPRRRGGANGLEEIQALKENVVQARVELAALKLSIDSANRNTGAQLTRISERIDRVERSQAEPAAKLTKALDTLERLSRGEAASKDVTGSVVPPRAG